MSSNASFLALAAHRFLDLHCDCRRGRTSAHGSFGASSAISTTPVGLARCRVCVARHSHVGAYYSRLGFCRSGSVCLPSPVRPCGVARTLSFSSRDCGGCHCLRDESLFRWWLGGTLCGSVLQQPFSILAISRVAPASRARTEIAVDDTGNRNPSRHRNHPPGDGSILCHQQRHPSLTTAVLRNRVLDWFLDQYADRRALAPFTGRKISNRTDGDASVVTVATKRRVGCRKIGHCTDNRLSVAWALRPASDFFQHSVPLTSYRLAVHDLLTFDPASGVARIHNQLGLVHDLLVVVVRMIRHDENAIVLSQVVER